MRRSSLAHLKACEMSATELTVNSKRVMAGIFHSTDEH
jgi:hypothetical protein